MPNREKYTKYMEKTIEQILRIQLGHYEYGMTLSHYHFKDLTLMLFFFCKTSITKQKYVKSQ